MIVSSDTGPSIVQPNAVESPTAKWMPAAFAIAATAPISAIISACDLRTFFMLWVSDMEKGMDMA
jgi:hypothetical protein